ncbi:MAG: Rpn family recombination-promoting nuclease/putative transposase [Ignavibacteria bacterium]|nr:Rpn family recombination-promoting nuclease/putative transposase [Ignavibacteria bacterium]
MKPFWILEADAEYDACNNKHDKGYKYILSAKRIFVQLLKSFVEQGWVNRIDEDNVERIDKSFVTKDFREKEADLIYKVWLDGREVFFYILLELQSTVDFQMPFRLLQYMVETWSTILKDTARNIGQRKDFQLPLIVPCVLYNGKHNWTACSSFRKMLDKSGIFGEYALDFRYILFDVNRYDEKKLLELANVIGGIFFMVQKSSFDELLSGVKLLVTKLKNLTSEDFKLLMTWLINIVTRDMPNDKAAELEKIINESEDVEKMVYGPEIAIKNKMKEELMRGKTEGKTEGKKEGKIEGKIEDVFELLSELGEVPLQIENRIKHEMDLAVLGRWLKEAARADSIDEFVREM